MSYQVIARKWRPQDFDAVVFQEHVSRTIRNSIRNGRIAHAYIFAGPRGVGKTTMARILAKAVNCKDGPTDTPCGVCENCREIREGIAFDVIEIDGASSRGIENIRELRENVNFAPLKSAYKVYIIDEVHMLTTEAFNALLKTLEEPPAHVIFVFATTEIHRVPDTILSRCQKYFFKKISIDAIVAHLAHIAGVEGFDVEERALYSIARASDGSMRDAQSLLDQMLSFSDGSVGEAETLALLGVVPLASYLHVLGSVAAPDRAALMDEVHRVVSLGVDIPRYVAGLLDVIRSLRLVKSGVEVREILGFSAEEAGELKNLASRFHDGELGVMFRIGIDIQNDLRAQAGERICLEMGLLDMASAKGAPSIAEILEKIDGQAKAPATEKKTPEPKSSRPEPRRQDGAAVERSADASAAVDAPRLRREWAVFLSSLEKQRQYLHVRLNQARAQFEEGRLILSFPISDENGFYSRIIDAKELAFIKEELSRRLGSPVSVETRDAPEAANSVDVGNSDAPLPEAVMISRPEPEELPLVSPVVEKVKDMFHGSIIDKGDE
ncbi:MAG TPA: DNA polymerase III subunit gamma/tau [Spirochaetota bacterium]|nr:DNA polymerase III subunit gamma/tau [Spirochaetota bacterium]HPV96592.1 DNA polymerase III subunit gamma/tau [Spirochaetota bacterium]